MIQLLIIIEINANNSRLVLLYDFRENACLLKKKTHKTPLEYFAYQIKIHNTTFQSQIVLLFNI